MNVELRVQVSAPPSPRHPTAMSLHRHTLAAWRISTSLTRRSLPERTGRARAVGISIQTLLVYSQHTASLAWPPADQPTNPSFALSSAYYPQSRYWIPARSLSGLTRLNPPTPNHCVLLCFVLRPHIISAHPSRHSRKKLKISVVCSSNMNRSMEAHLFLAKKVGQQQLG